MKDPQALNLLMRLNVPLPVFSQPHGEFLDSAKDKFFTRTNHGDGQRGTTVSETGDSFSKSELNSEAIDKMNETLIGTLQKFSIQFRELSPQTALECLSRTDDQSFFPIGRRNGATLPANIAQTVTNSDEVISLLNYTVGLNKADAEVDVDTLPLLLTQDKMLQRFSKGQELYGNRWHWLLPNKKSLFVSHGFTEARFSKDFLQELTIELVQRYLQERNISQQECGKLSYDLLCFIKSTYKRDKHGSLENYTKKLGNLQLFPVSCDGQPGYRSFSEVHQVLFPMLEEESVAGRLMNVMTNLRWPVPQFSNFCFPKPSTYASSQMLEEDRVYKKELFDFFKDACANFSEPNKVVRLVHDLQEISSHVAEAMKKNLQSVSELLQELFKHMDSRGSANLLKQLPIFFKGAECISIAAKENVIFCTGYLQSTKGLNSLTILGSKNDEGFMQNIGIDKSSTGEVYISHIIPRLSSMDSEEQLCHIEEISRIQTRLINRNSNEMQRLVYAMKNTKFLRNEEGVCHYISDLVLVKTPLQRKVIGLSEQLNTVFFEKRIILEEFLTRHGIQTQICGQKVLTYVKKRLVVAHLTTKEDREEVANFVEALSAEKDHLGAAFFQELSTLKFLPRAVPPWAVQTDIVPFDSSVPICFKESVERDGKIYAWSSSSCLERNYFGDTRRNDVKEIHSLLGITSKSNINQDIRVQNFKQICCLTEKAGVGARQAFAIHDYELLIKGLTDKPSILKKELGSFPCILQKDWTYSSPETTCVNITDEFQPYLWKFPLERGNMLADFEKFGMQREPSAGHFSKLLHQIADETAEADIEDPNVRDIVRKAFNEFLKKINKTGPKDPMDALYLPTEVDVHGKLRVVKSEDLVFDDWPHLRSLLKDKRLQFVLRNDLLMSKLDAIPLLIRPRRLKDLFHLTVTVADSTLCKDPTCDNFKKLQKLLSSEKFAEALVRLLRHYRKRYELPHSSLEVFETIRQGLSTIETSCYLSIVTNVKEIVTGKILDIQEREEKKATLIPESTIGINHNLFYDTERTKAAEEYLSPVVEQLLANIFPEKEYQWEILRTSIQNMLRATPNTLKDVLDQDNIDPMETLVEEKFEKLGEQIPDDVVAILITDPYRPLKKDAMVAYEFEEDKYVYAKLLESYEVVVDPSGSILIDIGEPQPCTVPILDIHFFPLIKENQNGDFALVVRDSGDNNTGAGGDNFESEESRFEDILVIFAKITAQMEEMYKTLKEDKKAWLKFVKRMVFKWHPDKNPEEKATEVTQFILNEAVRIWSGVQGQASSGGGSWSDPSGFSNDFYEEMFRQWGEQARSHRFTRERYHSNFSSRSSFHREEYKESQR